MGCQESAPVKQQQSVTTATQTSFSDTWMLAQQRAHHQHSRSLAGANITRHIYETPPSSASTEERRAQEQGQEQQQQLEDDVHGVSSRSSSSCSSSSSSNSGRGSHRPRRPPRHVALSRDPSGARDDLADVMRPSASAAADGNSTSSTSPAVSPAHVSPLTPDGRALFSSLPHAAEEEDSPPPPPSPPAQSDPAATDIVPRLQLPNRGIVTPVADALNASLSSWVGGSSMSGETDSVSVSSREQSFSGALAAAAAASRDSLGTMSSPGSPVELSGYSDSDSDDGAEPRIILSGFGSSGSRSAPLGVALGRSSPNPSPTHSPSSAEAAAALAPLHMPSDDIQSSPGGGSSVGSHESFLGRSPASPASSASSACSWAEVVAEQQRAEQQQRGVNAVGGQLGGGADQRYDMDRLRALFPNE